MPVEAEVQKIDHIPGIESVNEVPRSSPAGSQSVNEVADSPSQDEAERRSPVRVFLRELSLKGKYQDDAEDRDENEESCLVTQESEGGSAIMDAGEMKYIPKDWN